MPLPSVATVAGVLRPVGGFLLGHPAVLPTLLGLGLVAVLAAGPLARRLGCGRPAAALLLLACTAPLALTLVPGDGTDPARVAGCITGLRPPQTWGRGGQEVANLLMLVPAGALLVLLLRRRAALLALAVAAAVPLAVEVTQYLAVGLRRQCEVTDAVLNVLGLVLGAGMGLVVALRRRRTGRSGGPGRPPARFSRPRPAPGPRPSAWPGT